MFFSRRIHLTFFVLDRFRCASDMLGAWSARSSGAAAGVLARRGSAYEGITRRHPAFCSGKSACVRTAKFSIDPRTIPTHLSVSSGRIPETDGYFRQSAGVDCYVVYPASVDSLFVSHLDQVPASFSRTVAG